MKRKTKSKKSKTHEVFSTDILLNDILKKLHNAFYNISTIESKNVRFSYIEQHEDIFKAHFKYMEDSSLEYIKDISLDDILDKDSEQLKELIV